MSDNDIRRLENILDLTSKIIRDASTTNYEQFCADPLLPDACAMRLVALSEQVNRIEDDTQEKYPQIPWRQMYGCAIGLLMTIFP
jgi:uncharacterized protein with HEPN domain